MTEPEGAAELEAHELFLALRRRIELESAFGHREATRLPAPQPAAAPKSDGPAREDSPELTEADHEVVESVEHTRAVPASPAVDSTSLDDLISPEVALDEVRVEALACTRCRLAETRQTVVFGEGSPTAPVMFVGEGPGADEDEQGQPFVGRAGQLLTKIIEAIQLRREDVYIANVLKCRPPANRDPRPDEVACCIGYLKRQIAAIRPVVICTLGSHAARAVLGVTRGVTSLRGRAHSWQGVKVVPTWHPAYLLRNPAAKRETWDDIRLVRRLIDEAGRGDG